MSPLSATRKAVKGWGAVFPWICGKFATIAALIEANLSRTEARTNKG
jgi:hypothetical protein